MTDKDWVPYMKHMGYRRSRLTVRSATVRLEDHTLKMLNSVQEMFKRHGEFSELNFISHAELSLTSKIIVGVNPNQNIEAEKEKEN